MALASGTRLGPYEIAEQIGAGGMGEVYKAIDTRLHRRVAVKVLVERVASNPERKQRFELEAQAISSLSHPHICALYDVGSQDGIDFLVMEYLEGKTLAQRLAQGPLPLVQALKCAGEIASALDKAHRQGIVHRDLKPGNIMLTQSGAKLLDFGLAKLRPASIVSAANESAATIASPLTAAGHIVGTLQYMAPEQIEGTGADVPADVWAYGAVLFEMVSGHRAFDGSSAAGVISTIMMSDPPALTEYQPAASALLGRIIRKCLAKDPRDRWQSMHDVAEALSWIGDPALAEPTRSKPVNGRRRLQAAAVGVTAVVALVALGAWIGRAWKPAEPVLPSLRLSLLPPSGVASYTDMAVSPDGRRIVVVGRDSTGKSQLWLRLLASSQWQSLPGTEGGASPFWAPDNRFIAFEAGGRLRKIDVMGGPPQTISNKASFYGGAWSRDGTILFNEIGNGPLVRVPATGGTPSAVTKLSPGEVRHVEPHFLPDGQHFLFGSETSSSVYVGALNSSDRKLLLREAGMHTVYAEGRLFFERSGTLMSQQFDAERLILVGDPAPVAPIQQGSQFDITASGVLAYQQNERLQQTRLEWFDRSGKSLGTIGETGDYYTVELSPDGRRASGSILGQGDRSTLLGDVWIHDRSGGPSVRLTFSPENTVGRSIWSPDGQRLVFMRRGASGVFNLFQTPTDGRSGELAILEDEVNKYPLSWSADGRFLMYMAVPGSPTTGTDLWVLPLFGDRKPFPYLATSVREVAGRFSPDGRWIAYISNVSGKSEVHVASFPNPSITRQVSSGGQGAFPRWRRNGKEIFWLYRDTMMSASVSAADTTFEVHSVRPLFKVNAFSETDDPFDVTPDGERFLVIVNADVTSAPLGITILTNVDGLTRR